MGNVSYRMLGDQRQLESDQIAHGPIDDKVGQLTATKAALQYILGGMCRVTFVGKSSRFTYQVRRVIEKDGKPGDAFFVGLLTGPDTYHDYAFIGTIFLKEHGDLMKASGFRFGKLKARMGINAPAVVAFHYVWDNIIKNHRIPTGVQVWHDGRCARCSRRLTVPSSVASGFGPECINKIGM